MSIVLGCDPGLASFGLALVDVDATDERVVALEVLRTEKSSRKRSVLAADDNVRRCRELSARLLYLVGQHRPRVICAESMSHPRGSSAAAKLAMSWGALATVAEILALPLVQAAPKAIKLATAGSGTASKEDVQAALERRYPGLAWPSRKSDVEHAADALGAVVACLESDVVRMARRLVVAA